MMVAMLRWWYGAGWLLVCRRAQAQLAGIARQFSTGELARTLLAPWRRIVSTGARGVSEKLQDALGNVVSRFVGFFVRLFVLIAAGVSLLAVGILTVVVLAVWPLVPLGVVFCLVRGVTG